MRSTIIVSGLDAFREKYKIPDEVVLRIPMDNEVACSFSGTLDELCLFEQMFSLGDVLSCWPVDTRLQLPHPCSYTLPTIAGAADS